MPKWVRMPRPHNGERNVSGAEWHGHGVLYGTGADQPTNPEAQKTREMMDWKGRNRERAPGVQHEAREQEALTKEVATRWWRLGYRHIAAERASTIEALMLSGRGVQAGTPDVLVHIPATVRSGAMRIRPRRLALELKQTASKSKTEIDPRWWLSWVPDTPHATHYGLRGSQEIELQLLEAVGYRTMVAYGAAEAIEWLDLMAGPQPIEPVPWPRYGGEIDDWRKR